jgi:metal-sulfur cluster biosynthetic enzyme
MNNSPSESTLLDSIRDVLRNVYDPEFGISVLDLGLIYEIRIDGDTVAVDMTLTTMACPAGQVMLDGVRAAVASVPGVREVDVALVWDPAWTPERLSAAAREQLGWAPQPSGS